LTPTLPETAKRWLDAPEFATIATVEPDGQPQLSVVWVKRDGDDVLVSTVKGRRKHTNLLRDKRVTLLVFPAAEPYKYVEMRGTATMTDEGGPELIQELSQKYKGRAYPPEPGNERVVVRISPVNVSFHG